MSRVPAEQWRGREERKRERDGDAEKESRAKSTEKIPGPFGTVWYWYGNSGVYRPSALGLGLPLLLSFSYF